ncbi:uncharacterized protein A4U43_C04F35710 [Asparagus officinalis]|uniref:Uncharacterized protein n=1 Tax=Asparagus officinalis TaxID=4686 RepID=A0A5P1FAL1_ASPOF|nr:uncharacterized protein A4U43_C04F35710 [Asparagus officinalis]
MSQPSDSARTEQIITQFQLKALQAILGSRIPNLTRPLTDPTRSRKRDRWFNLALGDLPSALENPSHGVMDPMVVDVLSPMRHRRADGPPACRASAASLRPPPPAEMASLYREVPTRKLGRLCRVSTLGAPPSPSSGIFKMLARSNHSYKPTISAIHVLLCCPVLEERGRIFAFTLSRPSSTPCGYLSLSVELPAASLSEFQCSRFVR